MKHTCRNVGVLAVSVLLWAHLAIADDTERPGVVDATVVMDDAESSLAIPVDEGEVGVLQAAVDTRSDHFDRGSVLVLNNGLVVLETGLEWYEDDNGELLLTPLSSAVIQLPSAFAAEGQLHAVLTYDDVDFDLSWTDDENGTLTVWDDDGPLVFEVTDIGPDMFANGTAGCNAACGPNGQNTCSIVACKPGQSCQSWCDGDEPRCRCTKKPIQMQTMEPEVP